MNPAFSVIIPAYNEERTIERAIQETAAVFKKLGASFEILVIDDGSSDRTTLHAERLGTIFSEVRCLRHPDNRGKGAAVQTGVIHAKGEMLLFLDCDLSTHPSQIFTFLPSFESADILIGSRRALGSIIQTPQPIHRIVLGQMFNTIIRTWLHIPFKDTQCGFKVFTRDAARKVFSDLKTHGWAFDVEVILRAKKLGFQVSELPVIWTHGRESRVRLRDAWRIFLEIYRLRGLYKETN